MTDSSGHTLTSAEKNCGGKYLQKVRLNQGSQKKEFQLISRIIVTPDKVFEAFIGFDDELAIDNNEYLHLTE